MKRGKFFDRKNVVNYDIFEVLALKKFDELYEIITDYIRNIYIIIYVCIIIYVTNIYTKLFFTVQPIE